MKLIQLKLIDGKFASQDARELLLALFSNKVQFHVLKNFSSQVRYGVDDPGSTIRIAELEASKELIAALLTSDTNGRQYRITSNVNIELLEEPQ